jgi:hypothetical protein
MTSLPLTDHEPRSMNSAVRKGNKSAGGWPRAALADPNLFIIVAFCLIGLLVTFNLFFRFPSFGPSVDRIAQILG